MKEKYKQDVVVFDPLVVHKLEVFIVSKIIERYYELRDKRKMPRVLISFANKSSQPTNYLAEKLNWKKVTEIDKLKSKLYERQKKALLGYLLQIIDNASVWIITPARISQLMEIIHSLRRKFNTERRFFLTKIKRLVSAPATNLRPKSVVSAKSRTRPQSVLRSKENSVDSQSARTEYKKVAGKRPNHFKPSFNLHSRPLSRSPENSLSAISLSRKAGQSRAKSAGTELIQISELAKQEREEIIVLPTQIELNQVNRITSSISTKFKYQSRIRPISAIGFSIGSRKKAVTSREGFATNFPKFSESTVNHLSTSRRELLKCAMNNDLEKVARIISRMEYGFSDFSAKEIGSPLFWAIKNKNLSMTTLLLENGANPNKPIKNGEICLHQACRQGSRDVTSYHEDS